MVLCFGFVWLGWVPFGCHVVGPGGPLLVLWLVHPFGCRVVGPGGPLLVCMLAIDFS